MPLDKFDHTHISIAGLNTLIAPSFATISGLMWLFYRNWHYGTGDSIRFEDVVSVVLAGAVSVTGCCYTVNWWAAAIIGFLSSPIYFACFWVVREKLRIDDPLGVVAMHACCGYYSILAEGLFANGKVGHHGLFYGGFNHFGVQLLGIISQLGFEIVSCLFLWHVLLKRIVMRQCGFKKDNEIRVTHFDTFLGVQTRIESINRDFQDILNCENADAKTKLYRLHEFCLRPQINDSMDGAKSQSNGVQEFELTEDNADEVKLEINGDEDEQERGRLITTTRTTVRSTITSTSVAMNGLEQHPTYYSNCLDFLLAIKYLNQRHSLIDEPDKIRRDVSAIFKLYIKGNDNEEAKRAVQIRQDLVYQTMRDKDNGDKHCFDQAYREVYVKLTQDIVPAFLRHYDERRFADHKIKEIPYKRGRKCKWEIVWRTFFVNNQAGRPSMSGYLQLNDVDNSLKESDILK